ncbi:hypothetical protein C366_00971 [Cryptococcus neoformans Tu401-1]|nr:hypothetical protein C366_00971 [Cryptococcus neoformans var. grubii Tu401-1]
MSSTAASAQSASTSSFVTSLIVNSALAGGELAAFIGLRRWLKAIYEPRTYIPPKDAQAPALGKHIFYPIWQIIISDPQEILRKNGVDPYVFVRFLIMMAKATIPIWLVSWIVLLPIDTANSHVLGKSGLDRFTFGNVSKDKTSRYWAHLVMVYVFDFWIIWLLWGEMKHWLVIRQRHLINPSHSRLAQANTVLVTGIPKHLLSEEKLAQLFSHLPGGVKRIWLNRNLKEMPDIHDRRNYALQKLESAQVSLIKYALKYKHSREKKTEKLEKKSKPIPEALSGPVNPQMISNNHNTTQTTSSVNGSVDLSNIESGHGAQQVFTSPSDLGQADQLVPRSKRPTHRIKPKWAPFGLGFLGIGQKVDTIEWARKEIAYCTAELARSREQLQKDIESPGTEHDKYPPLNSAFIHFNQQIAAHMAVQCLAHNQPYAMNNRYIEQSPANVIWRNLSLNQYERNVRQAISWAATLGLILLWATPVAFIGALSNITTLTEKYHWLGWINGDSFGKKVLQGVISGILPPVLLAILMELVPVILRQLAAFEGIPSRTEVEINLMTRYFLFLVIHTFFIVTLASGLISAVQQFADNPGSAATTLATQMPTASTFFITLILTQFTGTMGSLLRVVNLLLYYVRIILLGGSPRSVFTSRYRLNRPQFGETFPKITVYVVIMIGYCVISPIINGFSAAFFVFATLVYKYLYIWVIDQPPSQDTGGKFFPKAITHVFVGLYVQQVCLAAMFFLVRNDQGKATCVPQGALMVVLIVLTIAIQYTIIVSYSPLKSSLPLSLARYSFGMPHNNLDEKSASESAQVGEQTSLQLSTSREPLVSRILHHRHVKEGLLKGHKGFSNSRGKLSSQGTERPSEETTLAERDFGAEPGGDDIELGVQTTSRDHQTGISQPTPCAATIPGPPVSRIPSAATSTTSSSGREEQYFAVPGGPGVLMRKLDDGNDPNAFFHPATKEPQRIVWLPQDELGLCEAELQVNERDGIHSSCRGAWLDTKGKVHISGPPPDDI